MKKNIIHIILTALCIPLFQAMATADTGPRPMVVTVPQTTTHITVDGYDHEMVWQQAASVANFLQTSENAFADEKNMVKLLHDRKNLYLFFQLRAFALDATSNQTASFKANHTKHDAHIWEDDSIEVRLEKESDGLPTYICCNANGAILDMRYENGTWLRAWQAKTAVKAIRGNGFWQVEMAIDLASLGMTDFCRDGQRWKLNLIRFDQRLKKTYSLVRVPTGNHTSIDNLAELRLTQRTLAPAVQEMPLSTDLLDSGKIPVKISSPQKIVAKAMLWKGLRLIATSQVVLAKGQGSLPLPHAEQVGEGYLQIELSDIHGTVIGRTTTLPYASYSQKVLIQLEAASPFTILMNGKAIAERQSNYHNLSVSLVPGDNLLTIRSTVDNPVHGQLACRDDCILVTRENWSRPFHLLRQVTTFLPRFSDGTWRLTRNGTYVLFWDGSHASRWDSMTELKEWQLNLEVPEQLEFLGATYRKYRSARTRGTAQGLPLNEKLYDWESRGTQKRDGITYRLYRIRRKKPVRLTHNQESWLQRIVRQDDGCSLAFKATGLPGSISPIRFRASAQQGLYRELTNTLNVEILPELQGNSPQTMAVMLKNLDGGLADTAIVNQVFDTIKDAGVNEYFGECNTDYLRNIGVRHFNYFNLNLHPHEANFTDSVMQKLYRDHPRAKGRQSGGINPGYINRHPETWPYLAQAITMLKKGQPSLSAAWWDYEFSPFPDHLMIYPCFDYEVQRDFAKEYGLKGVPSYQELKVTYRKEWTDFTCGEVATMFKNVRSLLHHQQLPLYVYSGYQGCPNGKEYYNMDWTLAGSQVDRAYCGYHPTPKELHDTRQCLKGKPLVGALLKMGVNAQADPPGAMVLKALTHGGGVLLWYQNRYDGVALSSIAKASTMLAKLETIRKYGKPVADAVMADQATRLRVRLWQERDSDAYTLVAINDRSQSKTFSFRLKQGAGIYEYRTKHWHFDTDVPGKLTVPPGQTWVLRRCR